MMGSKKVVASIIIGLLYVLFITLATLALSAVFGSGFGEIDIRVFIESIAALNTLIVMFAIVYFAMLSAIAVITVKYVAPVIGNALKIEVHQVGDPGFKSGKRGWALTYIIIGIIVSTYFTILNHALSGISEAAQSANISTLGDAIQTGEIGLVASLIVGYLILGFVISWLATHINNFKNAIPNKIGG